jgi:hypothetical protein
MWDEIARLQDVLGDVPAEISVLKIQEEAGDQGNCLPGVSPRGAADAVMCV